MTIDPYAANPLASRAERTDPDRYSAVAAVKAPPKMFAGGTADYPAFTASGIDPRTLLQMPYGVRHAAAAEPDIVKVYAIFENYAPGGVLAEGDPVIPHPGLDDARNRMQDWLERTDLDTRTPEERAAEDDAEYAKFFAVDSDRFTHASEQERRKRAGEDPLEEFDELNERRRRRQQFAANSGPKDAS